MSWYCPSELTLANPTQTQYSCCVQGVAPLNHTSYTTQQQCQDNTSCCNNANQPGTGNLDVCCGGIDQGDPCTYHSWLSITQSQRDGICQYCATSTASNDPCISEVSLYCRCCDGCGDNTSTTTTTPVNRGIKRCPQFGPQLTYLAETWFPILYAIVWSYPVGTILELDIYLFEQPSIRACWEIIEFPPGTSLPQAVEGALLNPTPLNGCDSCTQPPDPEICTTTTTDRPPPAPYWCIERCCDGTIFQIDGTFPWDWSATLAGMTVGNGFLAQSFNNLNGSGLQECYRVLGPQVSCVKSTLIYLAPPTIIFAQTIPPSSVTPCEACLQQYECNQVGDVYQWFPPTLPPPAGAAVDTGANDDLCQCTTTTTTSMVTTTTTSCVFGCMNPPSCNYNPNATCDDGSCIAVVYGCVDDGFCVGTTCPNGGTCSNPTSYLTSPWPGCAATNYAGGATMGTNTCFGYCNCLDPQATNYNFTGEIGVPPLPAPGFINGVYLDCLGNFQMTSFNWNGNVGDTSCCGLIVTTTTTVCIFGCTDATSINYDPLATCDDGNCLAAIYGCMDDGCCTTGITPDPLVGDSCPGGTTGLYHLCPTGSINGPSYNSPTPPPTTAINYYGGANLDDGSCIYQTLNVTFFEVAYPPCVFFFSNICCANTYHINVTMANGLTIPQGDIKFEFDAYTTNPGVIYNANLNAIYTHNTVSTSLDFNDQAFSTCTMPFGSTTANWMTGLPNCITYEGAVPVRITVELTTTAGIILMGTAVLQDFTTASNISVGYMNNWDGTNTQTCDLTASSPGGIGACV